MSRALIQTTNQSSQVVATNGVVTLGSILRRFGCNCQLSGSDTIDIKGEGYYTVDATISVTPTAADTTVAVALYNNGFAVPGAVAYGSVSAADGIVTLPISTTIRQACCGEGNRLTLVMTEGSGTVVSTSVRVQKL